MATYNWAYKPNVSNKYGIAVQDTPDDVRPNNACYVALFGNDITGNGSRMYPFKTILKGSKSVGYSQYVIIASGVYRDSGETADSAFLVGDGDVVIDGKLVSLGWSSYGVIGSYNVKWRGYRAIQQNANYTVRRIIDCYLDGVTCGSYDDGGFTNYEKIKDSVIKNTYLSLAGDQHNIKIIDNTTFYNCNIQFYDDDTVFNKYNSLIFVNCNISFVNAPRGLDYSLFYNCNFLIGGTNSNQRTLPYYPTIPSGYSPITSVEDLREGLYSEFSENLLPNCIVADPKFNSPTIGDFSLALDSPAKNRSYFGTYIGALSIGYAIKADSVEADGDFDFSTNVNLTVADNSIVLTDPELEASIESKVKTNLIARELSQAPIFGFYADRNGQYLDTIEDLSMTSISAGTDLVATTPYIVENAAITYEGAVIQPGERFTTTDVLDFTTDTGGTCREILEAPQRHTIMARFNDGRTIVPLDSPLVIGYWYYVFGTVTYESVVYTDQVFKATTVNPFTGTGNVVLAMGVDVYQHYEPGIKFTSNNVGDVRTGEIVRGNGDPDYERGAGKEFPINARFIQIKYIIKVNNLKP